MPEAPLISSPLLGIPVTLGNLAIWLGLASSITCVALYWIAMLRTMRHPLRVEVVPERGNGNGNGKNGRSHAHGVAKKNGAKRHLPPGDEIPTPDALRTEGIGL